MRPLALAQLAAWCDGRVHGGEVVVESVALDSRALAARALFVALRGERVDGHDFVAAAARAGAAAALVERLQPQVALPQLVVADAQAALGRIAAGLAATRTTTVLALTGSNGKTTVKTLAAAMLARHAPSYANPGNRNNEIGLPLALLEQPEAARYAVYEMGAGAPGDIAYLTTIARPRVALVNNIGPAHLERMGSLLGIARTKGAIYAGLPADGTAVLNADDAFCPWFEARLPACRRMRFALEASAEVRASAIRVEADGSRFLLHTPDGEAAVWLPLPGRHNIANALAASALALAVEVPLASIVETLSAAHGIGGRLTRYTLAGGALVIDDSYNANPASTAAAIQTLAAVPGERVLVLGDMRELGTEAARLHAEVGARAREAGIERLFAVGELAAHSARAFGAEGRVFGSQADLIEALRAQLHPGSVLLVKGSRGSRMERVVAALRGRGEEEVEHAA